MKKLTLAICEGTAEIGEVEKNLETLRRLVADAANRGADVVVTPELFSTGYSPATAAATDWEPIKQEFALIAKRNGVALVASSVSSSKQIMASFFTPEGVELASVPKHHLFGDEPQYLVAGESYGDPFEWEGFTFGLGTCFDIEYASFGAHYASRVDALLIPTAVPDTDIDLDGKTVYFASRTNTLTVPARALDTQCYVAYANHNGDGFTARSCLCDPFATVLSPDATGVALLEMDKRMVELAREIYKYPS